ncbi:hypothetical protein M5K25_010812 [Dendrobium thyrsiflorum]|uniref:Uncharacterized protein n=1 Tax=Dendrobium thyrsiflorum TaxID=117978 RepID=A0ABD0V8G6_DENTH
MGMVYTRGFHIFCNLEALEDWFETVSDRRNITFLHPADEIARLTSLRHLKDRNCPKLSSLEEMHTTNNFHMGSSDLIISDPLVLLMDILRSIVSLERLVIMGNDEPVSLSNEAKQWFLNDSSSLSKLEFSLRNVLIPTTKATHKGAKEASKSIAHVGAAHYLKGQRLPMTKRTAPWRSEHQILLGRGTSQSRWMTLGEAVSFHVIPNNLLHVLFPVKYSLCVDPPNTAKKKKKTKKGRGRLTCSLRYPAIANCPLRYPATVSRRTLRTDHAWPMRCSLRCR